MGRSVDGGIVIGASQPKGYNWEEIRQYRGRSNAQTIRDLSMVTIKHRLCSSGPGLCESCRLCEYGKEYVRRTQAEEK